MKRSVIIVAAGSGTRMNSQVPKQFMLLNGLPVLMHTINRFHLFDPGMRIVLALPGNRIFEWTDFSSLHGFSIAHEVVAGGENRFTSVRNALRLLDDGGITGVHDGVRPLTGTELIKRCFEKAETSGNAVPCLPLNETIREIRNGKNFKADRSSFVTIQTPQCFRTSILKKAYEQNYREEFTDDASVVEASGEEIHLVDGEDTNLKITRPSDLKLAEALLNVR